VSRSAVVSLASRMNVVGSGRGPLPVPASGTAVIDPPPSVFVGSDEGPGRAGRPARWVPAVVSADGTVSIDRSISDR